MIRNLIILGSVIMVILTGFNPEVLAQSPKGVMKGVWHHNLSADWLDPSLASPKIPNMFPLYFFHDALLKIMPDNPYSPCLAESWTVSPDYKVYNFKLRKGVKFHNGDEMTAEDVVFTFKRYKGGPASMLHSRIEKLAAEGPYSFSVTFKQPFPDFLEYLLPGASTVAWIVPKKYIEKVGDAGFKRQPIGAGPYKFVEFKPGVVLVGEAFEKYWRKAPKIKRMEIYSVTERSTRFAMVSRGEVDWALSMTDVFYEKLKKDPTLKMQTGISPNYQFLTLAAQWDPKSPWSKADVRKAASLAFDRQLISDISYPQGGVIGSLALPGDPEGISLPVDPYDPEQARKLLAQAGYPKGFLGGKFYAFQEHKEFGEIIANNLKAIGVELEMVPLERSVWLSDQKSGKMKGGFYIDFVGSPTINSRLAYLFGPPKYGSYPDIQELWDQYNRAVDTKVRKDLIGRIQKLIYEKRMVIPLVCASVPSAIGPRVKGNIFNYNRPPLWFPGPLEDLELKE